jgi:hypothetical protein
MQGDDAKLQSARVTLAGLEGTVRQQFGDALANATAAPASKLFQRLQSGQAVVLRVTLPASFGMAPPERIVVGTTDGRWVPAQRLSASPLADPSCAGQPMALHRRCRAASQSAHERARADIEPGRVRPDDPAAGGGVVRRPDVGLCAHGTRRFTRRYVPAGTEGDHGFMVTSGFHAGDQIVTQGAAAAF